MGLQLFQSTVPLCSGMHSVAKQRFGGTFQSSEARACQIALYKIFEYLAISQVCYNRFYSNHQKITVWHSSSHL